MNRPIDTTETLSHCRVLSRVFLSLSLLLCRRGYTTRTHPAWLCTKCNHALLSMHTLTHSHNIYTYDWTVPGRRRWQRQRWQQCIRHCLTIEVAQCTKLSAPSSYQLLEFWKKTDQEGFRGRISWRLCEPVTFFHVHRRAKHARRSDDKPVIITKRSTGGGAGFLYTRQHSDHVYLCLNICLLIYWGISILSRESSESSAIFEAHAN